MKVTVIRNLDWAIVWEEEAQAHAYRRSIDLAFQGNRIVHVGPGYNGPVAETVDGCNLMAMPGLINIHSHPGMETAYRGLREEHGVRSMYMSGLFERYQAYAADDELRAASAELAYCELLKSGVTSLVDIGPPWQGWAELMARSGLRSFLAPAYASARWTVNNDYELKYLWDEVGGRGRFEAALKLVDSLAAHPSGRLSGVVTPAQIDTCSAGLLVDSALAAKERNLPFTVHIAQSVNEVNEMLHRHGKTPIQWAAELGLLGPSTILGHAIFLDHHSWIRWWSRKDIGLIAEHGASVAHCPSPFARYGQVLESFGDYVRAGINLGMGTDVAPHNLIEEMRKASSLARIAARDIHSVKLADFLHAATVGGAKALLRDDLGRLAPGRKADIVLVDLKCPEMSPARDPLRSLVFHAADRAVRDVFVDGRQVVASGRVLTLDPLGAAQRMTEAQGRMMAGVPQRDYLRRSADEINPLSLPLVG